MILKTVQVMMVQVNFVVTVQESLMVSVGGVGDGGQTYDVLGITGWKKIRRGRRGRRW